MSPFPCTPHRDVAEPDLRVGSYSLSQQSAGCCPCSVSNLYFLKRLVSSLSDAWQLCRLGKAPCSKWINLPFEALCLPILFIVFVFSSSKRGCCVDPKDVFRFSCLFFFLQTGELLTLLAPYMAAPFSHAFNGPLLICPVLALLFLT